MPVPLYLVQKLLMSTIALTGFYFAFITILHHDLTRKLTNSLWQIIPGILIFIMGIFISQVLTNPSYVFDILLPIKSGFARGALGPTLPLIAASVWAMSIVAGLTALIDKMWFFWRKGRLSYIVRLLVTIFMSIIAGNTLFVLISNTPKTLAESINRLNAVSAGAGSLLGLILLLVTILAIPHIFEKKEVSN
jgi:hypothetical protein